MALRDLTVVLQMELEKWHLSKSVSSIIQKRIWWSKQAQRETTDYGTHDIYQPLPFIPIIFAIVYIFKYFFLCLYQPHTQCQWNIVERHSHQVRTKQGEAKADAKANAGVNGWREDDKLVYHQSLK